MKHIIVINERAQQVSKMSVFPESYSSTEEKPGEKGGRVNAKSSLLRSRDASTASSSDLEPEASSNSSSSSISSRGKKAAVERRVEELLNTAGFGFYHVLLVLVSGLATAADSIEVFGVSFVVPVADQDLELTTARKGWLDASIFMGEPSQAKAKPSQASSLVCAS